MTIKDLLLIVKKMDASDLHLIVGLPPVVRIHGDLKRLGFPDLKSSDVEMLINVLLYKDKLKEDFKQGGEMDFAFYHPNTGRYRVNVYRQKGSSAAALRSVPSHIESMEQLGLPIEVLQNLSSRSQGLVLVTGPTGSGKSTTLTTMIDYINKTRKCHILTLEDPIEYIHKHHKSMVTQREIGVDTQSYQIGLRAALREDPDVILVGEMRDAETIATAITAAETGHLVLSTLHTQGASHTIDRIIDVFGPTQQKQIKGQLANLLKGVISQQLILRKDGQGRCVAYEIMLNTPGISNLIREGKNYQMNAHIQTGSRIGMQTMDQSLVHLYEQGYITKDQMISHAFIPEEAKRMLNI